MKILPRETLFFSPFMFAAILTSTGRVIALFTHSDDAGAFQQLINGVTIKSVTVIDG